MSTTVGYIHKSNVNLERKNKTYGLSVESSTDNSKQDSFEEERKGSITKSSESDEENKTKVSSKALTKPTRRTKLRFK